MSDLVRVSGDKVNMTPEELAEKLEEARRMDYSDLGDLFIAPIGKCILEMSDEERVQHRRFLEECILELRIMVSAVLIEDRVALAEMTEEEKKKHGEYERVYAPKAKEKIREKVEIGKARDKGIKELMKMMGVSELKATKMFDSMAAGSEDVEEENPSGWTVENPNKEVENE